jgi:phosphoadenosine phosphosulfate reductase
MAQALREITGSVPDSDALAEIAAAGDRLERSTPQEILRWAIDEFGDRLTIATGFGAEGMALIEMAVKINQNPNVFFIDTGFLFPETYELRRRMEQRYGIEIKAFQTELTPADQDQHYGPRLWASDPDLCCRIRKLEPLGDALRGRSAWVTAIRRDQAATRAGSRAIEWDYKWRLVKVNPLVRWTKREVWSYIAKNDVPYNPLHDEGYPSIGCTHCTRAVRDGEDERAGRWSGHQKTECGLHGGRSPISLPVLGAAPVAWNS